MSKFFLTVRSYQGRYITRRLLDIRVLYFYLCIFKLKIYINKKLFI